MKKLIILLSLTVLLFMLFCGDTSKPDGENGEVSEAGIIEKSGDYPQWPEPDFRSLLFIGSGRGETLQEARNNAAADIVNKISQSVLVNVNSQFRSYVETRESNHDNLSANINTELQQTIEVLSSSILTDVQIPFDLVYWEKRGGENGEFFNYETYCLYPKAAREEALDRLNTYLKELAQSCYTTYTNAVASLDRSRVSQAFELLVQAKNKLDFIGQMSIEIEGDIPNSVLLLGEVEDLINTIQTGTQANNITGNNQSSVVDSSLRNPLSVSIQYNDMPFSGLTVEYSIPNNNGTVEGDTITDAQGNIECYVNDLQRIEESNKVVASFRYIDNYGKEYIFEKAQTEWYYTVTTPTMAIVVLEYYKDEDGDENIRSESTYATKLSDFLSNKGFTVFEYSVNQDMQAFNQAFRGDTEVLNNIIEATNCTSILICKAYVYFSSRDHIASNNVDAIWYRGNIELKILDAFTGNNLYEKSITGDSTKGQSFAGDGAGIGAYSEEVAHQRAAAQSFNKGLQALLDAMEDISPEEIN